MNGEPSKFGRATLFAATIAIAFGAGGCRPPTQSDTSDGAAGAPAQRPPTRFEDAHSDLGAGPGKSSAARDPRDTPVAGSTPAYVGDVLDPAGSGQRRRIELHWLRPAGGGLARPTLWEPLSECATPLRAPVHLGVGHWMIPSEGDAHAPANDACRPMRRIGALAGVDAVHVFIEARGERLSYRVRVLQRAQGASATVGLDGDLVPNERIGGGSGGHFGEVSLREFGIERLDGALLVTNFGIFRGTARAPATGQPGFVIVETTDLVRHFAPGELYWSAATDPLERRVTFVERLRFGDGRSCPDADTEPFTMQLRLLALHAGVRTWAVEPIETAANARVCAVEQLNVTRCRRIGCLQWSDSLAHVAGEHGWFLTESPVTAREIYARMPKWTIANRGYRNDAPRSRGSSDASQPWGECGLEGCDARRRREAIDSLLIDMWNR